MRQSPYHQTHPQPGRQLISHTSARRGMSELIGRNQQLTAVTNSSPRHATSRILFRVLARAPDESTRGAIDSGGYPSVNDAGCILKQTCGRQGRCFAIGKVWLSMPSQSRRVAPGVVARVSAAEHRSTRPSRRVAHRPTLLAAHSLTACSHRPLQSSLTNPGALYPK